MAEAVQLAGAGAIGDEREWTLAVLEARGELRFPGARLRTPELIESCEDGTAAWLLHGPAQRGWDAEGNLESDVAVDSQTIEEGGAVVLRGAGEWVADLVVLRGAAVDELGRTPEPLAVAPVGTPLGAPADLRAVLVGGAVLAPAFPWGTRMASEQIALSVYRIARLRGGPFWAGVAGAVAGWTSARLRIPGGSPSAREHLRLVADGALLMLAEADRGGGRDITEAAERALEALDANATDYAAGRWYRHDGLESAAGVNGLVLNTHLQAMTVLLAAGCEIDPARRALAAALALPPPRRAVLWAAGIAAGDALRAGRGPARRAGDRLARACLRAAGTAQERGEFVRLPGGRLLRDVFPEAEPFYYGLVNIADLAALHRNLPGPVTAKSLRSAIRVARSGYFAALLRAREPLCGLIPGLFRNAGMPGRAEAWARRLQAHGYPASIGWPGYEDALWSRLAAGTP